jgi:Tfp pilus assembly protein PilP
MRSVKTLVVGIVLAMAAPGLHAQANSATPAGAKPAPKATAQAQPHATQAAAKTKIKPAAKPAAKPKAAESSAAPVQPGADSESAEAKFARRDPFESLLVKPQSGIGKNLPPGKAGLQVSTLRLDGIVRSSGGMIAVVSNPQSRTYFLREGDQLYDGRVEKIAMDGVSFHEIGKDAFGKPVERQVNKRIYASAGEQQ